MELKWDLNSFFLEGSSHLKLKERVEALSFRLNNLKQLIETLSDLKKAIFELQEINMHLNEMDGLATCLYAQDISNSEAYLLQQQVTELKAKYLTTSIQLDKWLAQLNSKTFQSYLEDKDLAPLSFSLLERKRLAKERLSIESEGLISELGVDGFYGWSQMWESLIANMTFSFRGENLSFSQIENKLADPSRENRRIAFQSMQTAFKQKGPLFAQTLNHLAGYRLTVYRKRQSVGLLKEPLQENRIDEQTLQTVWKAIILHQEKLKAYMQCKASLLKVSKLSWWDLEAPIGETKQKISYEKAGAFIIKHLSFFSPKMGDFVREVLSKRWIDAENRPNKYPGGFCVSFPLSRQSRILMTYSDTMTNVFTLAHELGHAYHNFALSNLPGMAQDVRMSVAETASTMAETIITYAAIETAPTKQERLFILDDYLSRSVAYLMNIYARFLFEMQFYDARKKGFVSAERLNQLMIEAQKEAYGEELETYHPYFWAMKMHFYLADISFYNFPYTFGYLFSLGIYQWGLKQKNFEEKYLALLRDTGQMKVENLAQKHLNVDLTQLHFWEVGLNAIDKKIDTYLELASSEYV